MELPPLRFAVGDLVVARVAGGWEEGHVMGLHWRDAEWLAGRSDAPYQIKLLDGDRFPAPIYAPVDSDDCVRRVEDKPDDCPVRLADLGLEEGEKRCDDEGIDCPRHHVCADGVACKNYHFCGAEGRLKTRLRKKLHSRQQQQQQQQKSASGPAAATAAATATAATATATEEVKGGKRDVSLGELLAFIEGGSGGGSAGQGEQGRAGQKERGPAGKKKKARAKRRARQKPLPSSRGVPCDCPEHAHTPQQTLPRDNLPPPPSPPQAPARQQPASPAPSGRDSHGRDSHGSCSNSVHAAHQRCIQPWHLVHHGRSCQHHNHNHSAPEQVESTTRVEKVGGQEGEGCDAHGWEAAEREKEREAGDAAPREGAAKANVVEPAAAEAAARGGDSGENGDRPRARPRAPPPAAEKLPGVNHSCAAASSPPQNGIVAAAAAAAATLLSFDSALRERKVARLAEMAALEARLEELRAEQAADDELARQWPQISRTQDSGNMAGDCGVEAHDHREKCCAAFEEGTAGCCSRLPKGPKGVRVPHSPHPGADARKGRGGAVAGNGGDGCDGCGSGGMGGKGGEETGETGEGDDCDCDCHVIATAGREVVVEKLLEGLDFAPLFNEDAFEETDLDAAFEERLGAFEKSLKRAHGWAAVAKAH